MKTDCILQNKTQLIIILFAYLIFATIFGLAYRYAINPDGISHIRLAGYIAEGNYFQSISSSWSPLFSWLMSPFLYFGFEGLTAARTVIALAGAGLVLGCWFFSLRFDLSANMRFLAMLITALLISDWTIRNIGADILIAALLSVYFYIVTSPDILKKKKISFMVGIVGGIAFLSKNYALPFFIVHFPLTLLLKYYFDEDGKGVLKRQVLVSLIVGISGFLLISLLWISLLSVKYGHFTISSKGKIANAMLNPKTTDHRSPAFYAGLHKPDNPDAIHVFEDTYAIGSYETWSPFDSKEHFIYQLEIIKGNIDYLSKHFVTESPFFTRTFVIGILILIPAALLLHPQIKYWRYFYIWTVMTFVTYCSGYLLLYARSPRRFYAVMIVFLFISFHFLEKLIEGLGHIGSDRKKKMLKTYLIVIFIAAFALKPGVHFMKSLKETVIAGQVNPYREMADQINNVNFPSPYAIVRTAQKAHTDYYLAYYLDKQYLGRPMSENITGITKELDVVDAKALLVFDSPEIVEKLKQEERYIHLNRIKLKNNERYSRTVNVNIRDHEIISGWDEEVNIFAVK